MRTIALDCGASFIKGAVFEEDGEILTKRQNHAPAICCHGDITKPMLIVAVLSSIKEMLTDLAKAGGCREYNLCMSNEMHGFLLADERGNPITDYVSWQKEYGRAKINGSSAVEELRRNIDAEDLLYTGMELRSSLPSCNLLYLKKTGFFRDKGKKIYFYTLGDYILRKLSGIEPLCHPTNAAASGLYDLRTGEWNRKLTEIYEKNGVIFPAIGWAAVDFEWEGTTFQAYPAVGDQQAALFGAGLCSEREMAFNLGTGAQVTRLTRSTQRTSEYQIRPYFHGYYLKTIPHLPSGRAFNVYFRFIKNVLEQFGAEEDDEQLWDKILEAEKSGSDTDMKCGLGFFENPLTASEKGSIENIGEYELTMGNLFRAVFRQAADNFAEAAERLCGGGQKPERLIFSGGIARRIMPVRQRILERYGGDIEYTVAQDETLNGLYQYGNMSCNF